MSNIAGSTNERPDAAIHPAHEFLWFLFGDNEITRGPAFLCALRNDGSGEAAHLITRDWEAAAAFAAKYDRAGYGVFFCVSTLLPNATRRAKETIGEIVALFCDHDFKDIVETPDEVAEILKGLPVPPTRIVSSGHGFHTYWLLNEPLPATHDNKLKVEQALKALAFRLGGDSKPAHPAALMRLPGSHNTKNDGEWLPVEVFSSSMRSYDWDELFKWLETSHPPLITKKEKAKANGAGNGAANAFEEFGANGSHVDVEAELAAMRPGNIHHTQVRCTASLISSGVPLHQVVERILEATRFAAGEAGLKWDWKKEREKIERDGRKWQAKISQGKPPPQLPPPKLPPPASEMAIGITDFHSLMSEGKCIFVPSGELWPASSINSRFPRIEVPGDKPAMMKPAEWLARNRPVEQMSWIPGEPQLIRDRLVTHGGWVERRDVTVFNLYRGPTLAHGDADLSAPWVEHVYKVYPHDAPHIIRWLAHRVQRPHEKINHALVLGGAQGIGKDTIVEPVKRAVGPWNVAEVSPAQILGRFNGFVKSVIMRINEARDLGEFNRFELYERLKPLTAAPPDVLRVDEKNLREYAVPNVCGVLITSNHKLDGIYLPPDDRRHYVAWSDLTREKFPSDYWLKLWGWYRGGGFGHVAAYLAEFDLSKFDPKAPPEKTEAFWAIVAANDAPEDGELADVLDHLRRPEIVTIGMIRDAAPPEFSIWLHDHRNSRMIPHRMERCGYVAVRNPGAKDGLWVINGKRQVIYARSDLTPRDRADCARRFHEDRRYGVTDGGGGDVVT